MSSKRSLHLTVSTLGTSHCIYVPSGKAAALHSYLRSLGIPSSPPQPSSTGMDSIELGKGLDVKALQALLKRWS